MKRTASARRAAALLVNMDQICIQDELQAPDLVLSRGWCLKRALGLAADGYGRQSLAWIWGALVGLLLALALPLAAEPPAGPYVTAIAAASREGGIDGAQYGIAAGWRIPVYVIGCPRRPGSWPAPCHGAAPQGSRKAAGIRNHSGSWSILITASAMVSKKVETGDGRHFGAVAGLEFARGRWCASLSGSWRLQTTSAWRKEAWSPIASVGRDLGPVWLMATWSGPDSTWNRTQAFGLAIDARHRRGVLRVGLQWLKHRQGAGLRVVVGAGIGRSR